jgi:outer membrane protein, multidrug efflux system
MAVVVARPLVATIVVLSLTVTGCRMHRVTADPPPPITVPGRFAGDAGADPAPDRWWRAFGDPALDALIARALDDNFTLAAAWARLEQGDALVRIAGSFRLPEVTADAAARYGRDATLVLSPPPDLAQEKGTRTSTTATGSVGAGYEVDLWGRISSGHAAAGQDALALRDDVETIATTIVAQVTEVWLDLRFQRARQKLLVEQLDVLHKTLELLETRFREGLGTALDVYQQRSLVSSTESLVIGGDSAIVALQGQLAVLLGTTFDAVVAATAAVADTLPEPPPVPAVGVPASLLDRRPDVRAARRRVEAADHRVAVAVADRLPALRLGAEVRTEHSPLAELGNPLFALFGSVTAPLFDYGRRKAEVARTRAVVEQRLAEYGEVMVEAMVEVEVALAQERHQHDLIAELLAQDELASNTVREARTRYREGQIDYLPVLSALQAQQQIGLALLQARRQLLSLRVTLYRALGGAWTEELRHD